MNLVTSKAAAKRELSFSEPSYAFSILNLKLNHTWLKHRYNKPFYNVDK
jgi:hypothetical protein